MSTAPEPRIMVTREMIEAHYKSIMTTTLTLLSQGHTFLAKDLLSEACSRPYPIPAPAAMPIVDERNEDIRAALRRAYKLGQTYWHQTMSESYKEQGLSFDTQKEFEVLVDETVAAIGDAPERIAALEAALQPFTKHNSSEPTVTITVPSAAVTRARSLLAEGTP